MPKPLSSRTFLDDLTIGVRKAAAIKAALELEVFTRIAEGNSSLPAFRKSTGLGERASRQLLDALSGIGLLIRTEFEYALSPAAEAYLVKGKPAYYGDVLLAQWSWEGRGQLSRAVKNGKPLTAWTESAHAPSRSAGIWLDPLSTMQEFAPLWEQILNGDEPIASMRLLAYGADAGLRMLPVLQNNPKARMVIVHPSNSIALYKGAIETVQGKGKIEWVQEDWLAAPLTPESFHLAFVDSITEEHSIEQAVGILHHVYESLPLDGRIVLRAAMVEDDRSGPDAALLFALDLLLGSADGDVYTRTEYRGMLEAAGFYQVKSIGERAGIMTAKRTLPPPPLPAAETMAPDFIPPPEILD